MDENMKVSTVEDLEVFKKVHDVTLKIYRVTAGFPKEEVYGLVSQMRRAAVSINSNLSEGGARPSSKEFKQFIGIARGSAVELMYQTRLSCDLEFINKETSNTLINELQEIKKMLNSLYKNISNK